MRKRKRQRGVDTYSVRKILNLVCVCECIIKMSHNPSSSSYNSKFNVCMSVCVRERERFENKKQSERRNITQYANIKSPMVRLAQNMPQQSL